LWFVRVPPVRVGGHPAGGCWYLRFSLSYRDIEELLPERELSVDHVTVWRWVQRYAAEIQRRLRLRLRPTNASWPVDGSLAYDRRLPSDSYDPQRLSVLECGGYKDRSNAINARREKIVGTLFIGFSPQIIGLYGE
jgi:hypothetical protein